MSAKRQRPMKLRQASAYYRLAAKASRAGQHAQAAQYRKIADRFVDENRRAVEEREKRARLQAEWRERQAGEGVQS